MNDREIIKEFLAESRENLDQLDSDLLVLEKAPRDRNRLASVFRHIHTIKGTCGFFGFDKLEAVTHAGETLLSRLRDGHLVLNPDITSGLLALVDMVRRILTAIENTGQEGNEDTTDLVATLSRLKGGSLILPPEKPKKPASASGQAPGPRNSMSNTHGSNPPEASQLREESGSESPVDPGAAENAPGGPGEGNLRVDVGLLDKLMNLVGELVLTRNQIVQHSAHHEDNVLAGMVQRLDQIATELQEGVMKTRMQPISNVWNKLPRIARDLSLACGKQVHLILQGADTELDKTILEAIKDPLTHLLRNAVDHGIETPEARRARGKPPVGCLTLRAFHEGGQVNIEVSDDGAGINLERIKTKAIEAALLSREAAARLTEREAFDLIFLPGLSTADRITSVSGRGVGMDVVKTNIEKIGGALEIQSRPGQGMTVKIKIPLTLAIVPALIVTCGGERFAIPQASLLELLRVDGSAVVAQSPDRVTQPDQKEQHGIEWIHGTPVYRLRGKLLPLVDLPRELKLPNRELPVANIVVLQADERRFGLIVDKVNDTQEIVVKPLGKLLKSIPLYAGATILGDGQVVLILDVLGIAQRARIVQEARTRLPAQTALKPAASPHKAQSYLICEFGRGRRVALPVALLARLEEIAASAVERADHQEVVQCRGGILPLIRLSQLLPATGQSPTARRDALPVVVITDEGQTVGLVVDRIVDIVETGIEVWRDSPGRGVLGSAVIGGRVTDLLDIPSLLRMGGRTGRNQDCLSSAGV